MGLFGNGPGLPQIDPMILQPGFGQSAPAKKKGFFKGGDGFDFWDILGGLGDGISGNPIYANAAQQHRQAGLGEQQYQRRRTDELADYEAKQQIEQRYGTPPHPCSANMTCTRTFRPSSSAP